MSRITQIKELMAVTTESNRARSRGEVSTNEFCGLMQHVLAETAMVIAQILDEMNEREKAKGTHPIMPRLDREYGEDDAT